MEYKKMGNSYYVRFDYDDEIISGLIDICKKENIKSATFFGIGGCKDAEIQTFIPEKQEFNTEIISGMLELITINGNIITDSDNNYFHHTHALYTYIENGIHKTIGGHMKSTKVLYTAEIKLDIVDGVISRKHDPITNTGFWDFK